MPTFSTEDVIAAIATPAGSGGVGIIRISGKQTAEILCQVFSQGEKAVNQPRQMVYGEIGPKENPLDDGFGVYFAAPFSYTGENSAELHCHGSWVLLTQVLEAVLAHGARMALPGEFTLRAFLQGKIDLSQAESVQELIDARTPAACALARERLHGALKTPVEEMEQSLLSLLAAITVAVDFPEDADAPTASSLLAQVDTLIRQMKTILAQADTGILYGEGVNLVLAGPVNAGKSSLLNALLQQERAIVTQEPGTTRDVIQAGLNLDGLPVQISDTAGLRQTENQVEALGIEKSRSALAEAALQLVVLDLSSPDALGDLANLALPPLAPGQKRAYAWNKLDLCPTLPELPWPTDGPSFMVSARTGAGLLSLVQGLKTLLLGETQTSPAAGAVGNLRQKEALQAALESLQAACLALQGGMPLDFCGLDLENAATYLGEITGRTASAELLDTIFSRFCLGK